LDYPNSWVEPNSQFLVLGNNLLFAYTQGVLLEIARRLL